MDRQKTGRTLGVGRIVRIVVAGLCLIWAAGFLVVADRQAKSSAELTAEYVYGNCIKRHPVASCLDEQRDWENSYRNRIPWGKFLLIALAPMALAGGAMAIAALVSRRRWTIAV